MARQDANAAFAATSFLYGGNAAYLDQLYADYQKDPSQFGAEWAAFFAELGDEAGDVADNARGASWKRSDWPIAGNGELVSALDSHWGVDEKAAAKAVGEKLKKNAQAAGVEVSTEQVQQATRDSVRAIMMIRAYRMRGHLAADLDPLDLKEPKITLSSTRAATVGRKRISAARSSSTRCWALISRPSRDARNLEAHLLLHARRGVHAHLRR
jgi:2-oxoglutarate dehydrogenase E1 component